jgi:hypothetical protein
VQVHFVMTPAYGDSAALYAALTGVAEEIGEMLGISVFVYALLVYAAEQVGAMRVEFNGTQKRGGATRGLVTYASRPLRHT